MGNSSSKSPKQASFGRSDSISKPKALASNADPGIKEDQHNGTPGGVSQARVHRHATAQVSHSPGYLSAHTAGPHRRSRSAVAMLNASRAVRESAPPPYEVAVGAGMPGPSTLAVPQANVNARRRSFAGASIVRAPAGVPSMSVAERMEALRRPMRQNSVEDALETLRKYNTVIVVDDSGSMAGSRWKEARNALAALAGIASKYDTDGIDVCFLNSKHVGNNVKDPELVRRLFDTVRPGGPTPIGEKLETLLLYYLDGLERAKARADEGDHSFMKSIKPVNYIMITDGAATDDPEAVIVAAARRLDTHNFPLTQVGIQFVQIGNSPDATEFLNELDNGLGQNYGIRDIVDTTPYLGGELNAEIIIKILLGGINRRVDKRGGQSVV
ncbi:uncharacterized protein C8Q71DRAFT_41712 [Rhodofomes roseus]|uniref:VWFA domain-containing protein n=1 Tax=Rhodofomes roseus TaxID=34475 RepID=A0ABQ8KZE1_9APHY|nr:uncharacterized protein C8Q71DRAFT_41712 [Rhodofomes roseus]KAH9844363.1 hypothetical protein C8Q71DRAFT_41712 [Rhodofomes roseus]